MDVATDIYEFFDDSKVLLKVLCSINQKKNIVSFQQLYQLMKKNGYLDDLNCEQTRPGGGDGGSKSSRKRITKYFKKSNRKSKRKSKSKSKTKRRHKK